MVRKIAWQYYVISAIITTGIFFVGIWSGFFINKEKISYFEDSLNSMMLSQADTELEFFILENFGNMSCNIIHHELEKTMNDVSKLGNELEYYEQSERIKDSAYYSQKKQYTLMLSKYWIYWKRLKEICNYDVNLIIYFYSNRECVDCEKQASILAYFKQKEPEKNMIFAFDYDIDLNTIELLKKIYAVNKTPSLVINEKTYNGFQSLEEMKILLKQN